MSNMKLPPITFPGGVPILGQPTNGAAEKVLAHLLAGVKANEVQGIALVALKRDGNMIVSIEPGVIPKITLRGAIALLAASMDRSILGGQPQQQPIPQSGSEG